MLKERNFKEGEIKLLGKNGKQGRERGRRAVVKHGASLGCVDKCRS
jgi:hypothetical protein